jgi:UDP-N-acetylmuramate dehydrogenase
VLISATLRIQPGEKSSILERVAEIKARRSSSQPCEKSLGSVFKRIDGEPVSRMIDNLGLKGLKIGGAEVSHKHAGFIINTGRARASDVTDLIKVIKKRINDAYGVIPEEEIEFLE